MYKKLSFLPIVLFFLLFVTLISPHNLLAQDESQLDVAIVGIPELIPGTTSTINISIQNNQNLGPKGAVAYESGLSEYYGSAVGLIATLKPGDAPVNILTEKILLGNLQSGVATPPIPFTIEITKEAVPGVYNLSMELSYSVLFDIDTGEVTKQLKWASRTTTPMLKIEIKEPARFEIIETDSMLQAGDQKQIKLTFTNKGQDIARDTIAKISADYPLSVTDDTAFLGDIRPNEQVTGIFGIQVKGDSIAKEYPLNIQIKYTDSTNKDRITGLLKHPVNVASPPSILNIQREYLVGGLIGGAVIGIVWLIWFLLKMKSITNKKE